MHGIMTRITGSRILSDRKPNQRIWLRIGMSKPAYSDFYLSLLFGLFAGIA